MYQKILMGGTLSSWTFQKYDWDKFVDEVQKVSESRYAVNLQWFSKKQQK